MSASAPTPQSFFTTQHEWLLAVGIAILTCLCAAGLIAGTRPLASQLSVALQDLPDPGGHISPNSSSTDQALLIPGARDTEVSARMRFVLPVPDANLSRWVVWMERSPVDRVYLQQDAWLSQKRDFFFPDDDEGFMPSGFYFPLPATLSGAVSVDVHAQGATRTALKPRIIRESAALQLEQRGVAFASIVYASMLMLSLLAITLFSVARDRTFLAFFGYCVLALLMFAASNGHLYQWPAFSVLAPWRECGLRSLGLMFTAASLQMLFRYTGARYSAPRWKRLIDGYCIVLVAISVLCMLKIPWPHMHLVVQSLATGGWIFGALGSGVIVVDAVRHRIRMAWPLAFFTWLLLGMLLLRELMLRGHINLTEWGYYGYQIALLFGITTLGIGLLTRIGQYRDQRDGERLARAESERKMLREAARVELTSTLQTKLRTLAAGDIEWSGFRLLLDALEQQVPAYTTSVAAYGYHGHDIQVVDPMERKQSIQEQLNKRRVVLKRLAALGMPIQQPGTSATHPSNSLITEAVVPLPIHSPGWGVLLMERPGAEGFTTEELALVGDLIRITLLQIDQAVTAVNLRRSAELDALTGIFNRRTIDQWLVGSFTDAVTRNESLSILFLDLDHFKSINDRLGHACGDHCLRELAATLRKTVGEGNLLARYGGEEFIVVLPGHSGAAARVIGERLRAAVENTEIQWEGQRVKLSVSVGVATRLEGESTPATTIDRADKALYAAKRSGRNCVQVAPAVFA